MGFIYLLAVFTNKHKWKRYVGQTKRTIDVRWTQHMSNAKYFKNGSVALENAIRKYGADAFECIQLTECDNADLNELEIKFIDVYDTMYPKGYNLTRGGSQNIQFSKHSLEKSSKSHRQYAESKDLPLHTFFDNEKQAYAINGHGKCKSKRFSAKTYGSLNLAKNAMLECYKQLDNNPDFDPKTFSLVKTNNLEKGINQSAENGYRVRVMVNGKTIKRVFESPSFSMKDKLDAARRCLNDLRNNIIKPRIHYMRTPFDDKRHIEYDSEEKERSETGRELVESMNNLSI